MRYILTSIAGGIGLLVVLWILNTAIAFGIFDHETDIWFVLPTWLAADAALIAALWSYGYLNRYVGLGFVIAVLALAMLYLTPVNSNFPERAHTINERMRVAPEGRYAYAEALFWELEKRWDAPVRQYLLEPHKVFFIKDAAYFWNLPDGSYVDSNVQAHLYRNLLLASDRFQEDEVWVEQHFCTNSPHGVVVLEEEGKKFYADFWAVDEFPNYKFGQYSASPCDVLSGNAWE